MVSLPQVFPLKPCMHLSFPHIHATCPAHLSLIDLITRMIFGKENRAHSSSLCSLLHSPVTLSLPGLDSLLSTLLLENFSLCSFLNVSAKISHPCKITVKTFCGCVVTRFKFLWWVASTLPKLQTGGPPLVRCPRLVNQYIHSYPPHLRGRSYILCYLFNYHYFILPFHNY